MDPGAKIIYVALAVVFTASGTFHLYAAGNFGERATSWFGVDVHLLLGVAFLGFAVAWWVLLLVRPDLLSGA